MDVTEILDTLNSEQRQAACFDAASMLVLAGAGSGKTRVLVHRIAWLIRAESIAPDRILAVTFTNKAAREMRNRIESLLNIPPQNLWIGTFHGIAHRLLRRHAKEAGLPTSFQILDTDDQQRIVRRLIKSLGLDDNRWPAKQALWYINAHKDEGRRANHLGESGDPFERQMQEIYRAYEDLCNRSGLVDFAELLLRALELLRDSPELLDFYQRKFRHVLVDEFQDTNRIQYAWLRLLTQNNHNLFAVGDDDQSIYSWRGAVVENLQHFQRDYPGHLLVRLEQNYRSTGTILAAANALISQNQNRLGKNLWTDFHAGEPISIYSAFNEVDEAHFTVNRIQRWTEQGHARRDIAILYRSNAQSRQFEEKLVALGIPYRIYGGLRFFERAEIKDALGYVRLVNNRHDDAAFERIINTPVRGIGTRTLDVLRDLARSERISLWQAMEQLIADEAIPSRSRKPLMTFQWLIQSLADRVDDLDLATTIQAIIEHSGLVNHYQKDRDGQAEQRQENLEELVNAARQFGQEPDLDPELSLMEQFLSHAALEAGEKQSGDSDDCVNLMTLHAAKGLEFDLVFLVGLEEGLFPSLQSLEDPGRLEEERRLCYVGITRARRRLILTHAESRRIYGKELYPRASRFIRELPVELLEEIRLTTKAQPALPSGRKPTFFQDKPGTAAQFRIGQRVQHSKFGEGVILQSEGEGAQSRIQVNFTDAGSKWLMLAYANLTSL
jgi:DNA helicase-2/ATP-dependent DNA helicase PcrA